MGLLDPDPPSALLQKDYFWPSCQPQFWSFLTAVLSLLLYSCPGAPLVFAHQALLAKAGETVVAISTTMSALTTRTLMIRFIYCFTSFPFSYRSGGKSPTSSGEEPPPCSYLHKTNGGRG